MEMEAMAYNSQWAKKYSSRLDKDKYIHLLVLMASRFKDRWDLKVRSKGLIIIRIRKSRQVATLNHQTVHISSKEFAVAAETEFLILPNIDNPIPKIDSCCHPIE